MKIHKILQEIWDEGFQGKESFEDITGFDLYVDCYQRKLVEYPKPGKTLKLGYYITLSELNLEEDFAREIKWMKKSQGKFDFNSEDVQVGICHWNILRMFQKNTKKRYWFSISFICFVFYLFCSRILSIKPVRSSFHIIDLIIPRL